MFLFSLLAGGGRPRPGESGFYAFMPDGIFKTLLQLWDLVKSTYVTVFEWMGKTAFNSDFSVLSIIVGAGLFFVLGYWIFKFFIP